MSEPAGKINLIDLRRRAESEKVWDSLGTMVDDEHLLALIEAVEAAHQLARARHDDEEDVARSDLRDALARFDHEEPAR